MKDDWFGLPQRRVGHEGLEVALQVLTRRSAARTPYRNPFAADSRSLPDNRINQWLNLGGSILASIPGSILASAEGLFGGAEPSCVWRVAGSVKFCGHDEYY
jgi:hypothetical protein